MNRMQIDKPNKRRRGQNTQPKQQNQQSQNRKIVKAKRNRNVSIAQSVDPNVDMGNQLSAIARHGYGKVLAQFPSVLNFAQVYADPFSTISARIPMLPLQPSKLSRYTISGTGVIASSGTGWVACNPENMVTQAFSVFNNDNTGGPAFFAGGYVPHPTNSPYLPSTFDFGDNRSLSMRVVATGIRVRYQGTVLQASGDWYAVQTNPRQTLSGIDPSGVIKFPGNKTGGFKGAGWHAYTRHITSPIDFTFLQWKDPYWVDSVSGNQVIQDNAHYLGMIFTGTPLQTYEFEVTAHFELCGPNLDYTGLQNPHASGTEQVVSAFGKVRHRDRTTPDHVSNLPSESKLSKVVSIIKDGVEREFPLVGSAIKLFTTLMNDK